MISPKEAIDQLERMSGLDFFPKGRDQTAALKELRLALETARTVEIAESAVTDILACCTEAPKPSQLRKAVWEKNEQLKRKIKECPICGGSGQETVYLLITYHGPSFAVLRQEVLPDFNAKKAKEFNSGLQSDDGGGNNQTVLCGARPCRCSKQGVAA